MQTLISQFVEIWLQLMLKDVIWQTWLCLNISDAQFYYMFLAMWIKWFVQHLQDFQLPQEMFFRRHDSLGSFNNLKILWQTIMTLKKKIKELCYYDYFFKSGSFQEVFIISVKSLLSKQEHCICKHIIIHFSEHMLLRKNALATWEHSSWWSSSVEKINTTRRTWQITSVSASWHYIKSRDKITSRF